MKKFDLNIEKVLEDWESFHAIREIIANALDETLLAQSADIRIWRDDQKVWHIRDFGRGLQYQHLTQKENEEKLNNPSLIGKFGVGLKDALATFERRGVKILIRSRFGDITLARSEKIGFEDIVTLHAIVDEPSDSSFVGTEFSLENITDEDMDCAKRMFLKFSGDTVIETTQYGEVLLPNSNSASIIYISGVKVAEEENFLFSYNITSLNAAIKKALNRERTNVGRSAYTDRVKAILLTCRGENVATHLVGDIGNFTRGSLKDELKWTDVYVHACKLTNATRKVIFLTPNERSYAAGLLSYAKDDGFRIITVPDNVRHKLRGEVDYEGNPLRDLNEFVKQWNDSFQFKFVEQKDLTSAERRVYQQTTRIFELIGGKPDDIKTVQISETMRLSKPGAAEVVGVWEEDEGRIVVKRSQLVDLADYAGTLLHETAHAVTGAPDVSEGFERGLTDLLGLSASQAVLVKQKYSSRNTTPTAKQSSKQNKKR